MSPPQDKSPRLRFDKGSVRVALRNQGEHVLGCGYQCYVGVISSIKMLVYDAWVAAATPLKWRKEKYVWGDKGNGGY